MTLAILVAFSWDCTSSTGLKDHFKSIAHSLLARTACHSFREHLCSLEAIMSKHEGDEIHEYSHIA